MRAPVLVVGCGSELRRDDAVGRVVAERIAASAPPGVEVVSLTQLVPELVMAMADRELVVFVDAETNGDGRVRVRRVSTVDRSGPTTHHLTPEGLVRLARTLDLTLGEIIVVGLPVADLGLGMGLSAVAKSSVDAGEAVVTRVCDPM